VSSDELIGIKMGLSISKSTALVICLAFQCLNVLAQDMATTEAALNRLDNESRDWVQSSCPRSLGPSLWLNCVNREIAAVRAKSTQYESMTSEHLAWIPQTPVLSDVSGYCATNAHPVKPILTDKMIKARNMVNTLMRTLHQRLRCCNS
jgi:hypothetical protein